MAYNEPFHILATLKIESAFDGDVPCVRLHGHCGEIRVLVAQECESELICEICLHA
jgi:hypothetical protein